MRPGTFAHSVRLLRVERRLPQKRLALLAGVTPWRMNQLERGHLNATPEEIRRVAEILLPSANA